MLLNAFKPAARQDRQGVGGKFANALKSMLQQAHPRQLFDVILTLDRIPSPRQLQQLKAAGLEIQDYHAARPNQLLPGRIRKREMERNLTALDFVNYVEGIVARRHNEQDVIFG